MSRTRIIRGWKSHPFSIIHLFAVAIIAVSAMANITYGWTLGSNQLERSMYALMSGAVDGFKAFGLPLLAAACLTRSYLRVVAILIFLPLVVAFSFISGLGFTSTSTDESFGARQLQIQKRNEALEQVSLPEIPHCRFLRVAW